MKVSARGLGKRYGAGPWALAEVSFDLAEGEALGVLGVNGSGKTTLLRLLARLTEPSAGRAVLRGRVSCLIEPAAAFHPELTGRENLRLGAAMHGLSARELERRLDAIVAYAGLEAHLDKPLKHYSTGMRTRLGVALAAHLDGDILLVDELLMGADRDLARRFTATLAGFVREGRSLIVVSHAPEELRGLCARLLLLEGGRARALGETEEVLAHHGVATS